MIEDFLIDLENIQLEDMEIDLNITKTPWINYKPSETNLVAFVRS